ncbi:hypothetical protein BC941DRAFT_511305 [Chlamydoabsidia padenii]|nr:hypothetical protein BC941DRAFT_511305 [Chlamydoabsidia padenii]
MPANDFGTPVVIGLFLPQGSDSLSPTNTTLTLRWKMISLWKLIHMNHHGLKIILRTVRITKTRRAMSMKEVGTPRNSL